MSDEEIIKQRLLIDGDGTGDDRRLNMLLKQFLKWTFSKNDSPENNQVIYDRLLAQLAQCQFAATKNERTLKMLSEELKNYDKLSDNIGKKIVMAKKEIDEAKRELIKAKEIRKNKMEYDMLAKVIKEQPDRKDTTDKIKKLKKELDELIVKKIKLERKFQKRRNDFSVLMYAIRELEAQLEDDNSDSDSDIDLDELMADVRTLSDVDDESVRSNSNKTSAATKDIALSDKDNSLGIKEIDINSSENSKEAMIVDEDAILELSIEKDDGDEKMDDSVLPVVS